MSPLSVVFALALASAGRCDTLPGTVSGTDAVFPDAVFPDAWISDTFYRALANFTVRSAGNSVCQKQTDMYVKSLRNYTGWAVRMAESWIRHPVGIIDGNSFQLGVYDECVGVEYPVRGQYCISEVKLIPPPGKDFSFNRTEDQDDFGNKHSWRTILGWGDYDDQIPRNILKLGICIPESCTAIDLQTSLQRELDKVFNPEQARVAVKVDPLLCTVGRDMYPFDTGFFVTSGFFLLLILIGCTVTLHHFVKLTIKKNTKEINQKYNSIVGSFSFIKSILELIKYDKNNELNSFNGCKFIVMIFILFGHRFLYIAGSPLNHPKIYENIYTNGPDILLTSMNLVDPFFVMSGYLMYVTITPVFRKPGSFCFKFTSSVVYRVARILPAYCAMMAITAYILPHLGDGPFWAQKTWHEAEKCKNYWWTNLLFISNLIDVKYQCLLVSWYISCDLQFFIVGIIIVYIYLKNKKLGVGLLITAFIISLIIPAVVTYLTKSDAILKVVVSFMEDPRSSITFNKVYRPSYMRAIPYFAGVGTILIVEKLNENKFKFSKLTIYGGTFLVAVIVTWGQLYGALFYKRNRPYYPIEQAVYSSLNHCTWTVLSCWIIIALFTTGYGVLTKIISNRLFVILGRLSYSVFLVNLVVMLISQSSIRSTTHASAKLLLDSWLYDSFKTYLMAIMLHCVVEAPFGNVIRIIFGRGPKKDSFDANDIPVDKIVNTEISKNEVSSC